MDKLAVPETMDELRQRLRALRERSMPNEVGSVPHYCELCGGTGWYLPEKATHYVRCQCAYPTDPAEGVPYEFYQVTIATYSERDGQQVALNKALEFVAIDHGRDLYLFGGVGAGKTRLACAIANTLHRARKGVLFARVPMLLHQLQPGRDNSDLQAELLTVSWLVLDDIGAERDQATDYTRRTLLMLYEGRHDAQKRTIFTSNKSLQELATMQDDDRLTSRIAGRADVVRMTTSDQRLRKK